MKRALLFTLAFIFTLSLQAELHYKNYGSNGWHIGINENVVVDVDDDGFNDFYINGFNNELGFVPIFAKGCFSSPASNAYVNFGARELTIHHPGDILDVSLNTFAFIDSDRGSAYSANTNQLADGWVNGEDRYVAFFILTSGRFGWMRVALDVNAQKMIIKEMAYEDEYYAPVEVGYTGQIEVPTVFTKEKNEVGQGVTEAPTSAENLNKEVQGLAIFPNPVEDQVNINFDYQGVENLNIIITNSVGKEIYRTKNKILHMGKVNLEISTTRWNSGIYFIKFQSEKGIKTERLSVVK